jgi:hypothetical protein
VCKEFVFVLEFFDLKMAQIAPIFNAIFARVINKYLEWLEGYTCQHQTQAKDLIKGTSGTSASTSGGIDIYAVLLCVQLNEQFRRIMQQRNRIPVLDFYHDRVSMALWPKLTSMFQQYIDNIKRVNPKQGRIASDPYHPATARYVSFVGGIYRIAEMLVSG